MARLVNHKSELWDSFYHLPLKHVHAKSNGTHKKAWCRRCLRYWFQSHPSSPDADTSAESLAAQGSKYYDPLAPLCLEKNTYFYDVPLTRFLNALESVKFITGKTDSLFAHLRSVDNGGCCHISEDERAIIVARNGVKPNGTVRPGVSLNEAPVPPLSYPPASSQLPTLLFTDPSPLPPRMLPQQFVNHAENPLTPFSASPLQPFPALSSNSPLPSRSPSPLPPPPSLSPSPSLLPSPLPVVAMVSTTNGCQAKRARTTSAGSWQPSQFPWTDDEQTEFNSDICRLFIASGYAWNSVANAEWLLFAQKWIGPQARMPDRRTLSGPVLAGEVAKVEAAIAGRVKGKLAMLQCDGWKNIAKNPILGSLMTVEGEVILISTRNLSGLPKTGNQLLDIVKEVDIEAAERFGIIKIGHCTDDGPDGKKMRRLASKIWPHRVFILCWAHQNECIVKDIVKASSIFRDALALAMDIIKYVNNHDVVKNKFREQCSIQFQGQYQSLELPADTRWTSVYATSFTFTKVKVPLRSIFLEFGSSFVNHLGQNDTSAGVQRLVNAVLDDNLWARVEGLRDVLEAFAIATHILQAPYARLDHVLTTLGSLYHLYLDQSWHRCGLQVLSECALRSIATRFARAEQELFIYGVFANPRIRGSIYEGGEINMSTLYNMAIDLSIRFYGEMKEESVPGFTNAFDLYYHRQGMFEDGRAGMNLSTMERLYSRAQGKDVNLVGIWQRYLLTGEKRNDFHHGRNRFVMLAIHILSIIPNSASCERQFSAFGRAHSKLRNQLNEQSVHQIAVLDSELKRQHAELGPEPPARRPVHHGVYVPPTSRQSQPSHSTEAFEASSAADQTLDDADDDSTGFEGDDLIKHLDSYTVESREVEVTDNDVVSLCRRLGLTVPASRVSRAPQKYTFSDLFDFTNRDTITYLHHYWSPNFAHISGHV